VQPERSEVRGTDCSAIVNIVRTAAIPAEVVAAFEYALDQPLPDRLLAGLTAGHSAGGEFRPGVSAALMIVHREVFPYTHLRVDQNDQPIEEAVSPRGAKWNWRRSATSPGSYLIVLAIPRRSHAQYQLDSAKAEPGPSPR